MKPFSARHMGLPRSATVRAIFARSPYDNTSDRLRHWQHISFLANEMRQPVHAVKLLYENALMHLKPNAKVQNFLPIFVSKQLKRRAAGGKNFAADDAHES